MVDIEKNKPINKYCYKQEKTAVFCKKLQLKLNDVIEGIYSDSTSDQLDYI